MLAFSLREERKNESLLQTAVLLHGDSDGKKVEKTSTLSAMTTQQYFAATTTAHEHVPVTCNVAQLYFMLVLDDTVWFGVLFEFSFQSLNELMSEN